MNDHFFPPDPRFRPGTFRRPLTPAERAQLVRQQEQAARRAEPAPERAAAVPAEPAEPDCSAGLARRVAALEAEREELQQQLTAAQTLAEERLEVSQRVRADHVNYRRRIEAEREAERREAGSAVAVRLLPVLDDLQRALESAPTDSGGQGWSQGISQIARKLLQTVEGEGLSAIHAEGQPFDPALHEAVLRGETDGQHVGRVLAVVQTGYTLNGRVVRPALVKVGVPRSAPARPIVDEYR